VDQLIAAIQAVAPSWLQRIWRKLRQLVPFTPHPALEWALALVAVALAVFGAWHRLARRPSERGGFSAATPSAQAHPAATTAPTTASTTADPQLLFTLPPSQVNDRASQIRSVRLLEQSEDGLDLEVDYHYSDEFGGNDVVIWATGVTASGVLKIGSEPSVTVGVGTGTVQVGMRAVKMWLPFDTTALRVGYGRVTKTGTSRVFDRLAAPQIIPFAKSWKIPPDPRPAAEVQVTSFELRFRALADKDKSDARTPEETPATIQLLKGDQIVASLEATHVSFADGQNVAFHFTNGFRQLAELEGTTLRIEIPRRDDDAWAFRCDVIAFDDRGNERVLHGGEFNLSPTTRLVQSNTVHLDPPK
jgi:hypothetical protein